MKRLTSFIIVSGLLAAPAFAAPKITEQTKTYPVSATTATGLKAEMERRGPKGFWAYTSWNIRWTAGCAVRVKVVYTLPKHKNPSAMSPAVRKAFDAMLAALVDHEKQHGANGINAAREIDRAGCNGGQRIIRKYNKADRDLDRRTNHGAKTGVILR
ncbi:DUF922 domain-containing protein [uncultured Litoreibacter sp.]|uniref:DUF922 domain-containing protein n=1 Tax=uncultured Litoreibacter sp. TaxID=1392394 RepID=UPI00262BDCED|nr:DUF922 domain-containing protein [uncultured Litoreibacter sp.]